MKKKFRVPYKLSYHEQVTYWDVLAHTKAEAREIAVRELATDQDVERIASTAHIMDLGKAESIY